MNDEKEHWGDTLFGILLGIAVVVAAGFAAWWFVQAPTPAEKAEKETRIPRYHVSYVMKHQRGFEIRDCWFTTGTPEGLGTLEDRERMRGYVKAQNTNAQYVILLSWQQIGWMPKEVE